jgi:hypothetical protein
MPIVARVQERLYFDRMHPHCAVGPPLATLGADVATRSSSL